MQLKGTVVRRVTGEQIGESPQGQRAGSCETRVLAGSKRGRREILGAADGTALSRMAAANSPRVWLG